MEILLNESSEQLAKGAAVSRPRAWLLFETDLAGTKEFRRGWNVGG